MNNRVRNALVAVVAATLLASCGGDGSVVGSKSEGQSDKAKPYVDAMTASFTDEEDSPLDEEQGRCFSEKFIDVVGLDRIEAAGTPEEFTSEADGFDFASLKLTEKEGGEIYDNFDECGADMREALLADMGTDDTIDEATKACLDEAITDENLKAFFVTMMVEGEDAVEDSEAGGDLMAALMSCMMSGAGTESP